MQILHNKYTAFPAAKHAGNGLMHTRVAIIPIGIDSIQIGIKPLPIEITKIPVGIDSKSTGIATVPVDIGPFTTGIGLI